MPNLVLTVVIDRPGRRHWRGCGKIWAASLLRHQWDGVVRMSRNAPEPLFLMERVGLEERERPEAVLADLGEDDEGQRGAKWRREGLERRLAMMAEVGDAGDFDWVLLADADCVALRNLDHLFMREEELLVSRGAGGIDPGFVAVRGERLAELVEALRSGGGGTGHGVSGGEGVSGAGAGVSGADFKIGAPSGAPSEARRGEFTAEGLGRLVESGRWRVGEFERGEVVRPGDPGVTLEDLAEAAVVHFAGMSVAHKQRMAFSLHMGAVYGDESGLFFDMMEG